jgi:hypothetical protein
MTPGVIDRAKMYLSAEARHAVQGPASVQVQAERAAICRACDGRADEMEGKQDPGGIGFCTKCGCTSKRAALSVKLTMAGATCPLAKWQPVTGEGGSVATAIEAIGGVAGTVADQFTRLLRPRDT